jgi:ABC-2 type transport system ATP-binding protein
MTIFLTTHYMEEAEALCSKVAIIDAGKIIAMGSSAELKAQIPGNDIIFLVVAAGDEGLSESLENLEFVRKTDSADGIIRVYVDDGSQNLPKLLETAGKSGMKIKSVSLHEQSLEDVFIHYTGKSIRDEEAKKFSMLIGAGIPQKLGR